jgi:hypothetical protein
MPSSFTDITKPSQGDTTTKAFADAVVDNLNYLFGQISGLLGIAVPNSSFEKDTDADSIPDQWTRTLYTGGSLTITGDGLADTACNHGRRAIKFTSPGGASNGGGYLDSTDFLECTPGRAIIVSVQHYSSVATIRNKVDILFYTAAQVYISTANVYSSVTNPTSWQTILGGVSAPSTARYMKIRLIGAEDTTSIAGSAYFDDVRIGLADWQYEEKITVATTARFWSPPAGVTIAEFELIGGGGSGGYGDAGGAAGGGGGGGFVRAILPVTPGSFYVFSVGAGGTAPAPASDGVTGGTTSIIIGAITLIAVGGTKGKSGASGGAGGAGGTASGGTINTSGTNGQNRSGSTGGNGGNSPAVGFTAIGDTGTGDAGIGSGGGGAGGGNSQVGGVGVDGRIIIRF